MGRVVIPKKNGELRLCVDYRKLNAATISDKYALPYLDDLLQQSAPGKYISLLDLKSGYWQVPVKKADRPKTAFTCEFLLYQFKRMPFGIKNAPATFQRMVDRLRRMIPSVKLFAYLDDIMIISPSFDAHLDALDTLLTTLEKHNLRVKKCSFLCDRVKYLGHIITLTAIEVDPEKVDAILQMKEPSNPKEVQVFLQTASWYRKFIPNFAETARSISILTKQSVAWSWGKPQQDAYLKLKHALTTAPVLRQLDANLPFTIATDASACALGAVLMQGDEDDQRPIEYASRLLTGAERNYSATDREALAVVWALDNFRTYVDGCEIKVLTDHQALKWLMSLKAPSGRFARWALKLQQFDLEIQYRPGSLNKVADTLSRPPIASEDLSALCLEISNDSSAIRALQQADHDLKRIASCFENPDTDPAEVHRWTS